MSIFFFKVVNHVSLVCGCVKCGGEGVGVVHPGPPVHDDIVIPGYFFGQARLFMEQRVAPLLGMVWATLERSLKKKKEKNKARYTAINCGRVGRGGNATVRN